MFELEDTGLTLICTVVSSKQLHDLVYTQPPRIVCMYVYIYIVGRPLRANGKVDPKGPCSGYVKNALAFGSDPYSGS